MGLMEDLRQQAEMAEVQRKYDEARRKSSEEEKISGKNAEYEQYLKSVEFYRESIYPAYIQELKSLHHRSGTSFDIDRLDNYEPSQMANELYFSLKPRDFAHDVGRDFAHVLEYRPYFVAPERVFTQLSPYSIGRSITYNKTHDSFSLIVLEVTPDGILSLTGNSNVRLRQSEWVGNPQIQEQVFERAYKNPIVVETWDLPVNQDPDTW